MAYFQISTKSLKRALKEKENEKAFDEIMNRLNDGESLHAFFYLYCPKSYVVLFESMSQCMPFLDSLLTCIEMHRAICKSQYKNVGFVQNNNVH